MRVGREAKCRGRQKLSSICLVSCDLVPRAAREKGTRRGQETGKGGRGGKGEGGLQETFGGECLDMLRAGTGATGERESGCADEREKVARETMKMSTLEYRETLKMSTLENGLKPQ